MYVRVEMGEFIGATLKKMEPRQTALQFFKYALCTHTHMCALFKSFYWILTADGGCFLRTVSSYECVCG